MGCLRLLLALFVIASHVGGIFIPFFTEGHIGINFLYGKQAVCLFFMISGFYMSLVLTDKYKNSLKTFYTNRFLRIFPTYWLVLLLGYFFIRADYLGIVDALKTTTTGATIYFLFSNLFIVGSDMAYLISANADAGLHWDPFGVSQSSNGFTFLAVPTVFSLDIELLFYAVAPFLVRSIKLTVGVLFVAIIYHLVLMATNNVNVTFQYHLLPAPFLYFTLGILAHKMYLNKEFELTPTVYMLFFIAGCSLMFIQTMLPNLLLVLFPFVIPYLFELTKKNKFDRFLGDLSYPLYIVHFSVLKYCQMHHVSNETIAWAVTLSSLAISVAILLLFENPIEKYRARRVAVMNKV